MWRLVTKKVLSPPPPSSSAIRPFFTAHNQTVSHHLPVILSCCLPRCCYSAAIQHPASASDLKSPHFLLADHLITTWGFSPDKAARISKRLLRLKSPENPDAVLRFLTNRGFTDPQIKTLISRCPKLLQSSPQNTLDRNLRDLHAIGLSPSAVTRLILTSPAVLRLDSAVPRIKFWKDFLGGDEAALLRAFKKNTSMIRNDVIGNIVPKLSLLQNHGFSTRDVRRIVATVPRFITSNIASMENLLDRTKELGFRPESGGMFVLGLQAVTCATKEALQKKKELLKSFGWSEDEFLSAVLKAPAMVSLSEENLRIKMDFLVREVGYGPSYVASNPVLLLCSLEKRLRPRHHVLNLLESNSLSGERLRFFSAIFLSDLKFVEKYILPHEKEIAGLREAYLAACASGSRLQQAESSVGCL